MGETLPPRLSVVEPVAESSNRTLSPWRKSVGAPEDCSLQFLFAPVEAATQLPLSEPVQTGRSAVTLRLNRSVPLSASVPVLRGPSESGAAGKLPAPDRDVYPKSVYVPDGSAPPLSNVTLTCPLAVRAPAESSGAVREVRPLKSNAGPAEPAFPSVRDGVVRVVTSGAAARTSRRAPFATLTAPTLDREPAKASVPACTLVVPV